MKLYTFFRSSAAYRMRIALNLKGIAYDSEFVSLPKMEHRTEAFLKINPQGLVPVLIDGQTALIQSMATIEYLDETHPEPPLMPKSPTDRAYVRGISQVIGCDIHPLNNVRVLNYLRNQLAHEEPVVQSWYEHWIAEGFRSLEGLLTSEGMSGKYCFGDQVTMADVCLVPQVFNAQRFNCPTDDYPTVMAIFENCTSLKPFQDAHPSTQGDAA